MKIFLAVIATTISLAAASVHADEVAVRRTLQHVFPQGAIKSLAKTPVPGVTEAVVDGRILYLTDDGRYIFGGPLVDTTANVNLTQVHLDQIIAIPFDSLPLAHAIKRVKGDGSRKLAIFEDPDCPYCKKLEEEIKDVDNLTTYVFLYPLAQLHADATRKAKAIWCAPDRAKAWEQAVLTHVTPAGAASCDTPIDENVAFGNAHGINGTPTMILANGHRLIGAVSRDELEKQLTKASTK